VVLVGYEKKKNGPEYRKIPRVGRNEKLTIHRRTSFTPGGVGLNVGRLSDLDLVRVKGNS